MEEGNPLVGLILLAFMFICYMIPTFVASARKHPQTVAIGALNFLAGWTFIGWVIAIVWAFTNSTYHPHDNNPPRR